MLSHNKQIQVDFLIIKTGDYIIPDDSKQTIPFNVMFIRNVECVVFLFCVFYTLMKYMCYLKDKSRLGFVLYVFNENVCYLRVITKNFALVTPKICVHSFVRCNLFGPTVRSLQASWIDIWITFVIVTLYVMIIQNKLGHIFMPTTEVNCIIIQVLTA